MTVNDWGASFKFKSDFVLLFEKINNFIRINSILFSRKGIKISARCNNENLEIIFNKGKKKKKIISFSVYYKTNEEICIKDYEWEDININLNNNKNSVNSNKILNINYFEISKKVQSIDCFFEKINQVN
jgi:hypothetical protein